MKDKMTKERWLELMQPFAENDGINLTQEEIEAGWHWCDEWDGLLIHVDDDEFDCCTCSWMEKFKTPERRKMFEERMKQRYGSQEAMEERAYDYYHFTGDEDNDMPLFDEDDRDFMERL